MGSEMCIRDRSEAKAGVVDIQVTKVGVLWRKGTKKNKTRSPWREWGVILTGAQLYFFKNVSWVKNLMQQHTTHQRHAVPPSPVIFTPPIEDFRPDSLAKIDDAVALLDSSYTRHKHAFSLVRQGGEEEVFLADNEAELNEWLALINYAAAFRSAGVRIRGFIGASDGDLQPPGMRRLDSSGTLRSIRSGPVSPAYQNRMNPQLARQIMALRRKQMVQRIAEAELKMADMSKQLEGLLRNARHLQVLAPIQPRTRELIMHSAARMDAMLKWVRRDIWRTKCYKEILSMDALEDAEDVVAQSAKIRPLSMIQDANDRRKSFQGGLAAASPPRTPTSPRLSLHARTQSTAQTDAGDEDVFRTPPESAGQTRSPRSETGPAAVRGSGKSPPSRSRHCPFCLMS